MVASVERDEPLEPALADAARQLDAGFPATALLGLKDTFVYTPDCYFSELKPLWARAYRDLGRPQLAAKLDLMADRHDSLPSPDRSFRAACGTWYQTDINVIRAFHLTISLPLFVATFCEIIGFVVGLPCCLGIPVTVLIHILQAGRK